MKKAIEKAWLNKEFEKYTTPKETILKVLEIIDEQTAKIFIEKLESDCEHIKEIEKLQNKHRPKDDYVRTVDDLDFGWVIYSMYDGISCIINL